MSQAQIFELSKRYLALGKTLVFDRNEGKVVAKNVTETRGYRYGAFRTPIFLYPQIF